MLPRNCQMLLFSATFEDSVWKFAQKVVPDPNIIKLKREEETLDTIKQYYVLCNNREEKFQALCNLYGAITIAQAMIFCHVSSCCRAALPLPASLCPFAQTDSLCHMDLACGNGGGGFLSGRGLGVT